MSGIVTRRAIDAAPGCWAILPSAIDAIETPAAAMPASTPNTGNRLAIVPIYGLITQRDGWWGTSCEQVGEWLDAAVDDSSIGAIVLDVDTPGGSVYGVSELSDKIYAARGTKPIISVVNSLAASAGYWIASAADRVVCTPGGEVGSVGVVAVHQDISRMAENEGVSYTIIQSSKYKTEGTHLKPLADEAHAEIQRQVDRYHYSFVAALARNRGVSKATVETGFGEGRVFGAEAAIERKMIDDIGTLDGVVSGALAAGSSAGKRRAAAATLEIMSMRGDFS